jgi:hypothetical protein
MGDPIPYLQKLKKDSELVLAATTRERKLAPTASPPSTEQEVLLDFRVLFLAYST